MSNKSFRERYKYWKETGELPYSNGLIKDLPENQSEGVPVKSRLPGYDGGKDGDNIFKYTNSNGGVRYIYRDNPDAEEVPVRPLNTIFPDPAQWTFTDDAGRFYTPRRATPTNTAELNPDNRTGFERAIDNYIGEATNTIPKGYHTLPAIGAAAFGLASPALGEAALTSGFGAHGLTRALNGDIRGLEDAAMTALEIAPLSRVARPVYEGVVQPGMRLFNSPLTGNWTKIGNREYRLSPSNLGANGSPIESRKIGDYSAGIDLNKMHSIFEDYEKGLTQYKGAKLPNPLEYKFDIPEINIDFNNLTTDNFVDYLSKQTGRTLKRVPIKDTNHGDIYNEGFAFIDENGKEVAHIAGTRKRGKNVWVESSFVDPEFRYKGLGKQMYFDLNDHVFGTYGTTLHSAPMQRVGSTGVGMSPSNRLWKSLREKGLSFVEGKGFNRYDIMAEPSKITTAYRTPSIQQITAENAASITPEQWTAAQDAAIARGDMAEAQRLRDLHFKVSAPNTIIVNELGDPVHNYHGTTNTFTAFDPQKIGSTTGDKSGFFFSDNKSAADFYSHETGSPWNNLKLMLGLYKGHKPQIYDVYLNTTKPMITDFQGGVDKVGREILAKEAIKNGNDANILQNIIDGPPTLPHNVTIMRNPKHIKLADAVTYDDNGVRIPLGLRDNFKLNDIRYGLLPFLGLGAAGTLYGANQKALGRRERKK